MASPFIYGGGDTGDSPDSGLACDAACTHDGLLLSKLTGNVDPQKILDLASGELNNIPGFDGPSEGDRGTLGGYEAVQLGGRYDAEGKQGMIAQKTVVIPGQDGVYVLQLNAYSDESEAGILTTATDLVDEKTTITP